MRSSPGFCNVMASQPSKGLADGLDFVGLLVFFAIVGIFGIWVFSMFFKNLHILKGEEPMPQPTEEVA